MIENKELKYTRIENQPAQLFEGPLSEPSVLSCGSIQAFATSRVELKAARKGYLKSWSDKLEPAALLSFSVHFTCLVRKEGSWVCWAPCTSELVCCRMVGVAVAALLGAVCLGAGCLEAGLDCRGLGVTCLLLGAAC